MLPSASNLQREKVEGEDGSPTNDSLQAMMVSIDLAKQSLLVENPFFFINPESQKQMTTAMTGSVSGVIQNTIEQSLYGLPFPFIQQKNNDESVLPTNIRNGAQDGNHNSDAASLSFTLDSTRMYQKAHLYHAQSGNNLMYPQYPALSIPYNMQPHQIYTNGMFLHPQLNNNEDGIGAKRKLDQMNLNQTNIKSTEEDQSYNAVSATSSSAKSKVLASKDYLQLQYQHIHQQHTTSAPTSSSNFSSDQVQDKDPIKRRRNERNLREQERSKRINQQIKELRSVLNESNVSYKQNKYSILVTVVEYIKQLQKRSTLAENEQKRLTNSIKLASGFSSERFVNSSNQPPNGYLFRSESDVDVGNDTEQVKGIDYRAVFEQCQFPFAILSVDGRFLMCNAKFEAITGLDKNTIEYTTLFDIVNRYESEKLFAAISNLLYDASSEHPSAITSKLTMNTHYLASSRKSNGEASRKGVGVGSLRNQKNCDKTSRSIGADADSTENSHGLNHVQVKTDSFERLSHPFRNVSQS